MQRTVPRFESARRQKEALDLHRDGMKYRDIADQLGYAGPSGAHKAVKTARREEIEDSEPQPFPLAEAAILVTAVMVRSGDKAEMERGYKHAYSIMVKAVELLSQRDTFDEDLCRQQLIDAAVGFGFTAAGQAAHAAKDALEAGQRT